MMKIVKKNGSKQGVILVTVVFILAMAIIFISACMLMTQAARSRTYSKAEQSQARLTVTAAAEAFYQALKTQEFTDDTLETMSLGMSKDSPIKMVVTDQTIPGMTASDDNCTTLYLYQKKVNKTKYIYADFTTTIGDKTENVTVIFKYKKPVTASGLFTNQVDLVGSFQDEYFEVLGTGGAGKSDNNVIVRGDYNQGYAGNNVASNFIFTDGNIYLGHDANNSGDMVFLNDAVLYLNGGNATQVNATGDFYFVGDSGNNSFGNTTTQRTWGTGTWTFLNRSANDDGNNNYTFSFLTSGGKNVLLIDSDGNWDSSLGNSMVAQNASDATTISQWETNYTTNKSSYTTTVKNAIAYESANYDAESMTDEDGNATSKFPTASEAFSLIGLDMTAPSTASSMSFTTFANSQSYNKSGACVAEGTYSFTGGASLSGYDFNNRVPYVFVLDGTKDYVFYFSGTYDLTGVVFITINQTSGHSQIFVLTQGATMYIPNSDNWDRAGLNGFYSVNRNLTSAQTAYEYVVNGNLTSEFNGASYSSYYDGKKKPTIYIYGVGSNTIRFNKGGSVEGYIGLFDSDYTTSTSKVTFGNDYHYIYGRIQAPNVNAAGSAGRLVMPYCPSPNAEEEEEYTAAVSSYEVVDFRYYYNTSSADDADT